MSDAGEEKVETESVTPPAVEEVPATTTRRKKVNIDIAVDD
jgi:hypothetical protein